MTSPDAEGKTVINIPDPGESCTDGPSPTPVSNEECRIGGNEEGTTTIIVSGGHLGGVANVGFESDEEEEIEWPKNQLPDDNVDGNDAINTNEEQTCSSITSPSNIQPEIVTTNEGQTNSSSSSNSNSASRDDSVDIEHSADAGYKRIRDLPEAVSVAISEEERSDGENKPISSENYSDPLRREVQQNGTLPSDNEPQQQTPATDNNNNKPCLLYTSDAADE